MRCPLCEPHGLGMGLELLLCVPSASRRTHTARTAPYGTVAGWVAERRALIDVVVLDVVRTWIRPVPESVDLTVRSGRPTRASVVRALSLEVNLPVTSYVKVEPYTGM
jgi:hypothetical protein